MCNGKKKKSNTPPEGELQHRQLRMPRDGEVFAVVSSMLGANRINVRCSDSVERMGRIPGKMRKRVWIRENDIVLVKPWDFQDAKADVVWRYDRGDVAQLRQEGHIE